MSTIKTQEYLDPKPSIYVRARGWIFDGQHCITDFPCAGSKPESRRLERESQQTESWHADRVCGGGETTNSYNNAFVVRKNSGRKTTKINNLLKYNFFK